MKHFPGFLELLASVKNVKNHPFVDDAFGSDMKSMEWVKIIPLC